jgi:hypothetical protein
MYIWVRSDCSIISALTVAAFSNQQISYNDRKAAAIPMAIPVL